VLHTKNRYFGNCENLSKPRPLACSQRSDVLYRGNPQCVDTSSDEKLLQEGNEAEYRRGVGVVFLGNQPSVSTHFRGKPISERQEGSEGEYRSGVSGLFL
jgi:hypothetical protein